MTLGKTYYTKNMVCLVYFLNMYKLHIPWDFWQSYKTNCSGYVSCVVP